MHKEKTQVYCFAIAAIALGVLFDYLFFEKYLGVSAFVFEAALIVVTLFFSARLKNSFRSALWLMALALFFVAMIAVRDNMFLSFLNVLASGGLLILATKELLKKPISNFKIFDYIKTIVVTPFQIIRRFLATIVFVSRPTDNTSSAKIKRVAIGIIMALPFLLIFGALFASADLAFKELINSIFRFQIPDEFVGHVIVIAVVFAGSLGLFAYLFNIPPVKELSKTTGESKPEKESPDRHIEVSVFLWLIAGLFAIFLVFQIAYLFGGIINISQGAFTYAEYARKGFWELLTVSLFSLVILLIMDAYTKPKGKRFSWFTIPSLVLIFEIFVIIISAFKRLMLYQEVYGLTAMRLYAYGFVIFLSIIFILLAIKLWREREDRFFAFGLLLSMIAFVAVFNLMNPDAFIAKKNIERFDRTGKIDVIYLINMSADAVPTILDAYDRFSNDDKTIIRERMILQKEEFEKQQADWQSYNISRRKALKKLDF